jgi:hypothetical protein
VKEEEILKDIVAETAKNSLGKMIDGIGEFLGRICLPAADEIGLFLRDRIRVYRAVNLYKVIQKAQTKLKDRPLVGQIEPRSLIEISERSSWSGDNKIQDMWAGLLAGILLNKSQPDAELMYFNLLSEINPYQARIIDLVYGDDRICSFEQPLRSDISYDELNLKEPLSIPIIKILEASPRPLDYIVHGHSHQDILNTEEDHSLAFGFILPNITHLRRIELIKAYEISDDDSEVTFVPTITGLDFYMNCSGYKIYPIEAYLVTRKHWKDISSDRADRLES